METTVPRLPVDSEEINFQGWHIVYNKGVILKSICINGIGKTCEKGNENCCDLCIYRYELELPHLPDMVFFKNYLELKHINGAVLKFLPMDALRLVENGKTPIQVACSAEWKESRPEELLTEKFKPFDWTFTTTYKGTEENFRVEETKDILQKNKLMKKEEILFYHDLTLYEDELHDNGISSCSVKIRVMPSGFYILLRNFLRVDNVTIKIHDSRFHYEVGQDYILREVTYRQDSYANLKHVPPSCFINPSEIENFLNLISIQNHKMYFK